MAYASAAALAADDAVTHATAHAVTHATALARHPVRVATACDDPFYPGVQVLAKARGSRRLRPRLPRQPFLPGPGTPIPSGAVGHLTVLVAWPCPASAPSSSATMAPSVPPPAPRGRGQPAPSPPARRWP